MSLFAWRWYSVSGTTAPVLHSLGRATSLTAWDALSITRWILLLTGATAIALALAQARLRAPALPSTIAVFVVVLGVISTLLVLHRVVIDPPGSFLDTCAGAYVGLAACAAVFAGGLLSLRQEGILERDGPGEIPTLSI